MKNRKLPHLVAAFMLTPIAASIAHAAPAGRVLMVIGDASAERAGQKLPLKRGSLVEEGDRLQTGAGGSVQVMFTDQGLIALRENTSFKIDKYSFQKGSDTANFKLEKGGVRAVTGAVGKTNNRDYALDAVVATIGIRGTNFELVLCEGQCGDSGGSAKNGLYGVVRGASGGTSRIVIGNDAGEKLLGKNDSFFVADKGSPPQQLVAPPSFVTQRTESAKKSADKPKEADKSEAPKEAAQEKPKAEATNEGSTETASAPGPAPAPAPAPAPTADSSAATTTTTTTSTLVPPPTNQSTLTTTTTLVAIIPTTPPTQGGSTEPTPGGTTITSDVTPTPTPTPTPAAPPSAAAVSFVGTSVATGDGSYLQSEEDYYPFPYFKNSTVTYNNGKPVGFSAQGSETNGDITSTFSGSLTNATSNLDSITTETPTVNGEIYVLGRWGGDQVARTNTFDSTGGSSFTDTINIADYPTNLHFVVGPVFTSTSPLTGTIAYKLAAYTTPSLNLLDGTSYEGTLLKGNGDAALGTATTSPITAKVGYSFGNTLPPFVALSPFRLDFAAIDRRFVVGGDGSVAGNFKPILLNDHSMSSGTPSLTGAFLSNYGGAVGTDSITDPTGLSFLFGNFSVRANLMGTNGGGLGVTYSLIGSLDPSQQQGQIAGAMLLAKDTVAPSTPTITLRNDGTNPTTHAVAVAAIRGISTSENALDPTVGSALGVRVQDVSTDNGPRPNAFLRPDPTYSATAINYLANLGPRANQTTPAITMAENANYPGYQWGTWASPFIYQGATGGGYSSGIFFPGQVAALLSDNTDAGQPYPSLHYVIGPDLRLDNLPTSGEASYTLRGFTAPTSAGGDSGTLTRSTPDNAAVAGSLRATVGFNTTAGVTNLLGTPYLRVDSFRLHNVPVGQPISASTSNVTVAGFNSVVGDYSPIHFAPTAEAGVFAGSLPKVYKYSPNDFELPVLANSAQATLRAQLMGDQSGAGSNAGIGVTYALSLNPGVPADQIFGSMMFFRDNYGSVGTVANTAVMVTAANGFDDPSYPGIGQYSAVHDGANSTPVRLIPVTGGDAPKEISFTGNTGTFFSGTTVANFSGSNQIFQDGSDVDGAKWGRWMGGNVAMIGTSSELYGNTIRKLHYITDDPLSGTLPTGVIQYNLIGATLPTSTGDNDVRVLGAGLAGTAITAYVNFSPTSQDFVSSPIGATSPSGTMPISPNTLLLSPLKIENTTDQAKTIYLTGPNRAFSAGQLVSADPIALQPAGSATSIAVANGRFGTVGSAYKSDGTPAGAAVGTSQLQGQLFKNGATGLGITYSVVTPSTQSYTPPGSLTPVDVTKTNVISGAIYLKTPTQVLQGPN